MSDSDAAKARERIEEALAKVAAAARSFAGRARSQAGVVLREFVDPDGEAVASLVDVEHSVGAAALALPIDLITFETWVLGNLGDRDELDLDVNTHYDMWFGLGAWIAETLRERHGGFWLVVGEDPRAWRFGFAKILLEIAPHAFAERLLRSGQGLAKRLVAEVERLRVLHAEQAEKDGGEAKDRFAPQHYARLHTVPLSQWMVLDMGRLRTLWAERSAADLKAAIIEMGKKLPPGNEAVLAKVVGAFEKLDGDKPTGAQVQDRGFYEAVAQVVGIKRIVAPVAVDILEKLVLPALFIGTPDTFPPLGEDDVAQIKKGTDLFAVYVEVVPYKHPAEDGGFLGAFGAKDLATPYPDRTNLEVGKGDWVVVNPSRLRPMLDKFDPKRLLSTFDRFVEYVGQQEGVPRLRETGRTLAENAARALFDLKGCVGAVDAHSALVFRLLPPPG